MRDGVRDLHPPRFSWVLLVLEILRLACVVPRQASSLAAPNSSLWDVDFSHVGRLSVLLVSIYLSWVISMYRSKFQGYL